MNSLDTLSRFEQMYLQGIGFFLCIGTPLVSLGPSFIVWPTPAEFSFVALFLYALPALRKAKLPASVVLAGALFFGYVASTALLIAAIQDYPLEYPTWTLFRFFEWIIGCIAVCYGLTKYATAQLVRGLVFGAAANALAIFYQQTGGSVAAELMRFVNADAAGPWKLVIDYQFDPLSIEQRGAAGMFSYSRTATGFLLAMVSAAVFLDRPNLRRLSIAVILAAGIVFTGSRLGGISFALVLICSIAFSKNRSLAAPLVGILVLISILALPGFRDSIENPLLGRIFSTSEETFFDAQIGRADRQSVVWNLSFLQLLFGAGAGLIGFALNLHLEGFAFYGAHGFAYQYLGSVGVIGSTMAAAFIILCFRNFTITRASIGILLSLALCAFADDFLFPSAQSSHLPIVIALLYRYCSLAKISSEVASGGKYGIDGKNPTQLTNDVRGI